MKIINLNTTIHDSLLAKKLKDQHLLMRTKHYIYNPDNVDNFEDLDVPELHRARLRFNKIKEKIESPEYLRNFNKPLVPQFAATVGYAYLGDDQKHIYRKHLVYDFSMIISYRFEQNGVLWLSDGKYQFSPAYEQQARLRIVNLVLDDINALEAKTQEVSSVNGATEPVDGIRSNPLGKGNRVDAEPTGL